MIKKEKRVMSSHCHYMNLSYDNHFHKDGTHGDRWQIFKGAVILAPGTWSDSVSMRPIVYSSKELQKGSDNWESNYLNLDHYQDTNNRIGRIENPRFEDGVVKGDLWINKNLSKGKDTIEKIYCELVNWVSAEIITVDRHDYSEDKCFAEEICFLGAAITCFPACSESVIVKK